MRTWFLTFAALASWQTAAAQIDAFLPDVEGLPGDTVEIPVSVGEITGHDVRAFTFKVLYDSHILDVIAATLSGTLADGSIVAVNSATAGEFVVAAANARALSGSGVITVMTAVLETEGSGVLRFDYFQFNDGEPASRTFEGTVRSGVSIGAEEHEQPRADFRIVSHYPEPADDHVTLLIDVPETARVLVRVFDLSGREVTAGSAWIEKGERRTIPIDVGRLPQGIYLYRISNDRAADGGLMTVFR